MRKLSIPLVTLALYFYAQKQECFPSQAISKTLKVNQMPTQDVGIFFSRQNSQSHKLVCFLHLYTNHKMLSVTLKSFTIEHAKLFLATMSNIIVTLSYQTEGSQNSKFKNSMVDSSPKFFIRQVYISDGNTSISWKDHKSTDYNNNENTDSSRNELKILHLDSSTVTFKQTGGESDTVIELTEESKGTTEIPNSQYTNITLLDGPNKETGLDVELKTTLIIPNNKGQKKRTSKGPTISQTQPCGFYRELMQMQGSKNCCYCMHHHNNNNGSSQTNRQKY